MRVWILVLVFMMGSVLGVEGVSPGSYEVDFEAGLERDFVFDFVLDGKETLRVTGEMSKYVVLDKTSFFGGEVVASLKLPEKVEDYGVSNILIVAGDVVGIIKVNVDYPKKYVELDLAIPNVNAGEEVVINLKVSNFGNEGVNLSPVVEIHFDKKLVRTFEGDVSFVEASGVKEYSFSFESLNYLSGDYLVVVKADANGFVFREEDSFRLGEFKLEILDYTREVVEGDIEIFEIEVESFYDGRMKEVYAQVRPVAAGNDLVKFDTSIVSLLGWEKKTLIGYIDTQGLEGAVSLKIDVFYDGNVESKIVSVQVEKKSSFFFWVVGFFIFLVVGFFIWKFFSRE